MHDIFIEHKQYKQIPLLYHTPFLYFQQHKTGEILLLTLQNIEKQFGSKVLYNRISLSINPDYRIGLIGPNGTGKTVLLRILAGQEFVDRGQVAIPSDTRIGYLPQEMSVGLTISPIEYMLKPYKHLLEIESHIEQLASCGDMDTGEYKKTVEEYDLLQAKLAIHDVYSLNSRAKTILAGLEVPEETWDRDMTHRRGLFLPVSFCSTRTFCCLTSRQTTSTWIP
jgi:ATP-binding cassette subfamily F protein 3